MNNLNNKSYIGFTENLRKRLAKHRTNKALTILHRAIRKYGWFNFTVEQVYCSKDKKHILDMEKYFIGKYQTYWKLKHGYNMTLGGDGSYGYDYTESQRERRRQYMLEHNPMKGKTHPPEVIEKLRQAGRTSFLGRHHTLETRRAISEKNRGCVASKELREKRSQNAKALYQQRGFPVGMGGSGLNSSSARDYIVTSPTGNQVLAHCLKTFCLEHGLPYQTIHKSSRTAAPINRGKYKGWSARKCNEVEKKEFMSRESTKKLSQKEIVRAATNSPELSEASVTLGDRTFKIVDLPYDSYLEFIAHLQPLAASFLGKVASVQGMQFGETENINAASLITYCKDSLPQMAQIALRQTEPTITVEEIKVLAKNPFKLAGVVLEQITQNRMISDFTDFFIQIAPLMKAAAPAATKTTKETPSS